MSGQQRCKMLLPKQTLLSTSPWTRFLSLCFPALDGGKVLTGSLRVQTCQNLVQPLGPLDDLTEMGETTHCF